jgi:NHL repeat
MAGGIGDGAPAILAQLDAPDGVAVDRAGGIFLGDATNRVRYIAFGTITTVAGSGAAEFGGDGGLAIDAQLQLPIAVAADPSGGIVIADQLNHRIRRVSVDGTITTVAGVAQVRGFAADGGPATESLLAHPTRIALGRNGEFVIADRDNHRIRRVGPHGKISTVAGSAIGAFGGDGGPATDAWLNYPTEVLLDGTQSLLIADTSNNRVRSVDRDGIIATIAGGGSEPPADGLPATSVSLAGGPTGMALDRAGNLLICEEQGHRLWRLTRPD